MDIKATQVWNFCGTALSASGGVRYVEAGQTSVAVANSLAGDVGVDAFETSFSGWGPTLAVEAHRPLCEWFGVFANARQSIVFGEESTSTFARQAGGGGASAVLITHENDESLPITEVQVGGEGCCRCGIGAIVLRGAYEAQLWHHAGGPFNNSMDLTLQGASVSAGLIY